MIVGPKVEQCPNFGREQREFNSRGVLAGPLGGVREYQHSISTFPDPWPMVP